MLHEAKVDILLATYNGARFVQRQIESVLENVQPGWRILIRDDGSADDTVSIIERIAAGRPDCIRLIADGGQRLGASGNFARLLQHAEADYVMFCDQDDVRLPSRIQKPLERMKTLEDELGPETPLLFHTDLAVVDEELRPLSPSFWKYGRIDPRTGNSLSRLLVRNVVTGSATTINRAARFGLAHSPNGRDARLVAALVAAGCGRLEYLPEATVLYRQHSGNAIGARPWGWSDVARIVRPPGCAIRAAVSGELLPLCAQARTLLEQMGAAIYPPSIGRQSRPWPTWKSGVSSAALRGFASWAVEVRLGFQRRLAGPAVADRRP